VQWSNMAASGAADESSNLSRATIRQVGVCTFFFFQHGSWINTFKAKRRRKSVCTMFFFFWSKTS